MDVLTKPIEPGALIDKVYEAVELDREKRKRRQAASDTRAQLATLTPREREIAVMLAAGDSVKQVAHKLDIAHKTVDNHRAAAFEKLDLENIVQLVAMLALVK